MIGSIIPLVWPETGTIAFASSFNGKQYATSWIKCQGETSPGVYSFVSQFELDPRVLGQGGSVVHATSKLEVDPGLRPLRYLSYALGAVLQLVWQGDQVAVTFPNGTQQAVPSGGATYVTEAHMAGLDALLFSALFHSGQLEKSASASFFFVTQLGPLSCQFTAAPDLAAGPGERWYRTSFQDEILLDREGRLLCNRNPRQGIEIRRLATAPPRPEVAEAEKSYRPAVYTPPAGAKFRSLDVKIPGPVVPIGATLTIPLAPESSQGEAPPRPAVLFISGSGCHDRNGIAGELDFGTHEIVDYLSDGGFVGLRYDTRGAGTTGLGSDYLEAGLDAIIADALAAYGFLAQRPEVDKGRIFLVGHSQGGTVALALGAEQKVRVRGIALLATVARSIEELSLDQLETHGRHAGLSDEQIAQQKALMQESFALIRAGKEFKAGEVPDIHLTLQRNVPWFREWMRRQAESMIAMLPCPIFIANGEKDFQVSADKDAKRLAHAAERAHIATELRLYPTLDHAFKPIAGESTLASYYDPQRRVDPAFLADLRSWLVQNSQHSDSQA